MGYMSMSMSCAVREDIDILEIYFYGVRIKDDSRSKHGG